MMAHYPQLTEAIAFLRSDDSVLFPPTKYSNESAPEDTASDEAAPDIEIFVSSVSYANHGLDRCPNSGAYNFALHAACLR